MVDGIIMKIPDTTANVGAYYGNEENGQWQPNGVIIDTGVGGGVVGSGDAGVQRAPLYPVHLPRSHIPGYVMAGPYYPPAPYAAPPAPDDFADYMWMENEEEFDKQVMQQLEEEALMEQCIEAMLEDEQRERHRPNGHHQQYPTTSNGASSLSLAETVSRSRLNPLAAEFVPQLSHTDEKQDSPPEAARTTEAHEAPAAHTDPHTDAHTEPTPPPTEPPEVSAADVQPDDKRRDKLKKVDAKKPVKEVKVKVKPQPQPQQAKSDSKLPPREEKREVRSARSEDGDDGCEHELKPQPAPLEEPTGPKPINYAAAAKANKPKKLPTPPQEAEKLSPPPSMPKDKKKMEKPIQRKNSAK